RQDTQANPPPCGGTAVRDITSQNQDAGDTPGAQHPPAGPPQRTAMKLNAPDAAFVACTRSFRQHSRSPRRHKRYHISGLIGSDFAFAAAKPPPPPPPPTGRPS